MLLSFSIYLFKNNLRLDSHKKINDLLNGGAETNLWLEKGNSGTMVNCDTITVFELCLHNYIIYVT